jgi:acetoacetyl-CoA synthetase
MAPSDIPRKLWEHPNPESTEMYRFMQEVNTQHNLELKVRLNLSHPVRD